jgi:hypothetical protein
MWPGRYTPTPTNFSTAGNNGLMTRQWDALAAQMRDPGISGATFTQITDVEREFDGLLTYDRVLPKANYDRVALQNQALIAASRTDAGRSAPVAGIPPGTVAHWSFNEGRGKMARDDSGRRPLQLVRGATWTRVAGRGRALLFPRRGALAVGKRPVVDTRRSFTVSAWIMPADVKQTAAALAQVGRPYPGFALGHQSRDARPDLGSFYPLYGLTKPPFPPNRWTFDVPGLSANAGYGDVGPRPAPGRWEFVVGVLDRANRVMSLYVNGRPVENRIADYTWAATGPFLVGGRNRAKGARTFHGAVDDVRVFNRALGAAEVASLSRVQPG